MACLCAPTTHEGSFRCRFHRGGSSLIMTSSAQLASIHQKGAAAVAAGIIDSSALEISDQPCRIRAHADPPSSAAAASTHQVNCNYSPSSSSSSSAAAAAAAASPSPSTMAASTSTSLPLPSTQCARPPPAKRAISSSTSPSRSLYPGSSKCQLSAASRCTISGPSASHAAALAIMKQHLHGKHGKGHVNRSNNTMLRSSAVYTIGPSRLSRMSRACADEVPLLKKADYSSPPQKMLLQKSSSLNSDEPQVRRLMSMEVNQINFKICSTTSKFKSGDSSCKIMGYKTGPFVVPTVY